MGKCFKLASIFLAYSMSVFYLFCVRSNFQNQPVRPHKKRKMWTACITYIYLRPLYLLRWSTIVLCFWDVEIILLNTMIAYRLFSVLVFDIKRLKTYPHADAKQRKTQPWPYWSFCLNFERSLLYQFKSLSKLQIVVSDKTLKWFFF